MAWWAWLLVAWVLVGVAVALVLARAIRLADRRDRHADRPIEGRSGDGVSHTPPTEGGPVHLSWRRRPIPRQERREPPARDVG